jgi:hypothetical protein
VRIFKTKWFTRFARKEKIEAERLIEAVRRAENGSIDADLGGNLIKQRVSRQGQGRSGGYRTLIAFQTQTHSVFLYGFAKNEKDNIEEEELSDLKKLASRLLALNDEQLEIALAENELFEVAYDD